MTKDRERKTGRSDIAGAVYEMISDARDAGVVSAATFRSFDDDRIGLGRKSGAKLAGVKAPHAKRAAAAKA